MKSINKGIIAAIAIMIIATLVLIVLETTSSNTVEKDQTKKVATETTITTTTLAAIEETTTTTVVVQPSHDFESENIILSERLAQCRVALDEYSAAVEAMRQTLRTYDDAAMTDNQELADIALNTNTLALIPGLVAQYESCYQ